tara:strand:- start:2653 stop:3594 length:942 start_codon:yes stop_codon:yes gene_type:complete
MTVKYSLSDFYDINTEGFKVVLPDSVVDEINELVNKVGSPNYIRTPVFQKIPRVHSSINKKKRDMKMTINTQDIWNKMNKHQVAVEKDEDEISIQKVRSYLNKLTDKNIDDISEHISIIIQKVIDMKDKEMIKSIGSSIFEIASSNKFFSTVYAELYSILFTKYEVMQSLLEENYSSFLDKFETIEYISPDEDYDAFCRINKENDKRRALSTFYLNLYCIGVLPIEKIEYLLVQIMNKLLDTIQLPGKASHVEEYTENIGMLYQHEMEYNENLTLSNEKNIRDTVIFLANTKNKTFPSLTSKCIFKYMDICDM